MSCAPAELDSRVPPALILEYLVKGSLWNLIHEKEIPMTSHLMMHVLVELAELRLNETFRELALSLPDYADAIEAIGQRAVAATHQLLAGGA